MKIRKSHKTGKSPARFQKDHNVEALNAIELIDRWLKEDSDYDERTWPILKKGLEENRLSARRLFDA